MEGDKRAVNLISTQVSAAQVVPEDVLLVDDLCGTQIYGAFVLNRRVDLYAIDATPARWRGDADSSPLD